MMENSGGSVEPKELMNKRIQQLLDDVDKISFVVISVQNELGQFRTTQREEAPWALLKEQLDEVHTRLEGIREFICCSRREANQEQPSEEIDLWL